MIRGLIAVVILCLAFIRAEATDLMFDTPLQYHNRPNAKAVVTGDFNDDGIMDLAQAEGNSEQVMFYLGNGDGTFEATYPAGIDNGLGTDYVRVGDMNGDGLDDIVCLWSNLTSAVRVYYSDPAGIALPAFVDTVPSYVFSGEQVSYLELADENHDGYLDIMFGGYDPVVVMYNNGDSTFSDRTDIGIGIQRELVHADLNGDEYPDFILSNYDSTCQVTLSDGAGGYLTPNSVPMPLYAWGVPALVDITGDSILDIVYTISTDYVTGQLAVAEGLGNGQFQDGVASIVYPPGHKTCAVGNIFGDEFPDIVTTNLSTTEYVYAVHNQTGGLNFDPPVEYQAGFRPGYLAALDLNGDGYDDLYDHGWSALGIYLNNGDGTFPEAAYSFETAVAGKFGWYETHSADFTGDGYPEVLVFGKYGAGTTFTTYITRIYENDGFGQFTGNYDQVSVNFGNYYRSNDTDWLIKGDFIGDSSTDLVVLGAQRYAVYTGPMVGGSFTAAQEFALAGSTPVGIGADVDGDNDFDLVLTSTGNDLLIKYNDSGLHTRDTIFENVTQSIITAIDTADINHDGAVDFVAASWNSNMVSTIINDGSGNFSQLQSLAVIQPVFGPSTPSDSGSRLIDLVAADFNDDGYGDAAILWRTRQSYETSLAYPCIYILMNDGSGTLSHTSTHQYMESALKLVTADFDGDGDYDLACSANYPIGASVLLNDGSGNFAPNAQSYAALSPGSKVIQITANDFDRDGSPDIALFQDYNNTTSTDGTVTILYNQLAPAACCGQYLSGLTGNTNCSTDGKVNLADVTTLIDRVYLSKTPLCCEENGNTNGDIDSKMNLADITRLIDKVYLSKADCEACL